MNFNHKNAFCLLATKNVDMANFKPLWLSQFSTDVDNFCFKKSVLTLQMIIIMSQVHICSSYFSKIQKLEKGTHLWI